MEGFVKGDIVATLFPFSDLKSIIKRPALVLANLGGNDVILCQITKKERPDRNKLELNPNDIIGGNLKLKSFIRPSKLFTIDESLILYKIGTLRDNKLKDVIDTLIKIFSQ